LITTRCSSGRQQEASKADPQGRTAAVVDTPEFVSPTADPALRVAQRAVDRSGEAGRPTLQFDAVLDFDGVGQQLTGSKRLAGTRDHPPGAGPQHRELSTTRQFGGDLHRIKSRTAHWVGNQRMSSRAGRASLVSGQLRRSGHVEYGQRSEHDEDGQRIHPPAVGGQGSGQPAGTTVGTVARYRLRLRVPRRGQRLLVGYV
jgi:hypothetical protein